MNVCKCIRPHSSFCLGPLIHEIRPCSFSYEGWLPKQRRGADLGGGAMRQWIHASWYDSCWLCHSFIVFLFPLFVSVCLSDFFWSLWHCIFVKVVFLCLCHMLTHPKCVNRDVLSINQRNSCAVCTLKQQYQKYSLTMRKGKSTSFILLGVILIDPSHFSSPSVHPKDLFTD